MARRNKHSYRVISFIELVKHAHVNASAKAAMERYSQLHEKMRSSGLEPEIRFSEFNGYRIVDPLGPPYSN
jgi:hypothetical protein